MAEPFADRLAAIVEQRSSQVVLGLDPNPAKLWPQARRVVDQVAGGSAAGQEPGGTSTVAGSAAVELRKALGRAFLIHCTAAIDAAGPACVAIKPQLACFERLGADGWAALEAVVDHAQAAGLLVVADGKRGDVPVTANAYAEALLSSSGSPWGVVGGLGADACTVNPLLGEDSLVPFVDAARDVGAGLFVLARTSNAGAADLQDLDTPAGPLYEVSARLIAKLGDQLPSSCGLSGVGAVVGATRPVHILRLRELMPRSIFLLPGIGAQGGRVEDLQAAFAPGRAGALITASRSIVDAYDSDGGEPAAAACAAAEQLRAAAWAVSA